jgi:hypothetical protein
VVDHQDKDQVEDHSAEDHQEEEDHPVVEDRQEDPHFLCHKHHNQEDTMATNWWATLLSYSQEIGQKQNNSSRNGNYTKESTSLIRLCVTHINELCSFLTYIQGALVNEWVKGVNAWLSTQVTTQGWATTDERLWNGVIGAFNRQYADVLEQEKAQAELGRGLRMQSGDLDGLITKFETLVRHANYDVNQPLVLRIFTDALPHAMYQFIFKTSNHGTTKDGVKQQSNNKRCSFT